MARSFSNRGWRGAVLLTLLTAGFTAACGNTGASGGSGGAESGSGGAESGSGGSGTGGGSESGGTSAAGGVTYFKSAQAAEGSFYGASVAVSDDGTTLVIAAVNEDSEGAVYVYALDGDAWVEQAHLKASNSGMGDAFGTTLALSADGSTLAVGAPNEASAAQGVDGDQSDDSAANAGAVYLFARSGTTWSQAAYLKASSGDGDDYFGISLALSAGGDLLVVGAEGEDGAALGINGDESDKTVTESGAVYVFARSDASWAQTAYLKASNTGALDHFGGAVALSADGSRLAVGAYREDSAASGIDGDQASEAASSAGAVYLFAHDGSAWQQEAYVKAGANDGSESDNFGCAVSLSAAGDTLAVGAVGDPSASTGVDGDPAGSSAPYAGAAYLFSLVGSSWEQAAYLKASNTGAGDEFGYHLRLSADGGTLVVGAAMEASGSAEQQDDGSAPEAGAAYVFERDGVSFAQTALLKASNVEAGDRFGWSMALSADGSKIVVGATRESSGATEINGDQADNSASRAGAVYLFE